MAKANNSVMTRFTTGKASLTYAFLWAPRSSDNEDGDEKGEKYSTCILIPKGDQATIDKLNIALNYAVQAGQAKGLWGANLPTSFKWPLRDGVPRRGRSTPDTGSSTLPPPASPGSWILPVTIFMMRARSTPAVMPVSASICFPSIRRGTGGSGADWRPSRKSAMEKPWAAPR